MFGSASRARSYGATCVHPASIPKTQIHPKNKAIVRTLTCESDIVKARCAFGFEFDQLFAAPALAHASMSAVAAAFEDGPPFGMLPPIHDKIDCDGSPSAELLVPSICPLLGTQGYAPDADRICEWQPLAPQFPTVPLAK